MTVLYCRTSFSNERRSIALLQDCWTVSSLLRYFFLKNNNGVYGKQASLEKMHCNNLESMMGKVDEAQNYALCCTYKENLSWVELEVCLTFMLKHMEHWHLEHFVVQWLASGLFFLLLGWSWNQTTNHFSSCVCPCYRAADLLSTEWLQCFHIEAIHSTTIKMSGKMCMNLVFNKKKFSLYIYIYFMIS